MLAPEVMGKAAALVELLPVELLRRSTCCVDRPAASI
jgi:hypothetical protein